MYKILITILFIMPLLLNCTQQDVGTVSERINGNKLQLLVKDAVQGNAISNFKLSGFLISYTPAGENYNNLVIDSTVLTSGIKMYSVILEFPNPLFNILAVYDEDLNLYLQDNSLSGNIAVSWETISGKQYLVSSESFVAKDRIELSRLSLYSFDNSKLSLVFRSFTRLKNSGKIHEQNINFLSEDKITTRITSGNKNLNNKIVIYNYNINDHKYISGNDIFYNLILDEIKNSNWKIDKPELNFETAQKIKAELKRANQHIDENPIKGIQSYQRLLDSDRFDAVNIFVTKQLPKKLRGNLYINSNLGAQITINKLPKCSDVTQFVKYQFCYPTRGTYYARSSELETSCKYFIQLYDHACANNSYILILESPKITNERYNYIYTDIVKTFFNEC